MLTADPRELTIWDVVDAVEPIKRIRACPLGIQSHGPSLCPLHRRLDNALETIELLFRGTTVADVLSQPGSATPLCEERKVVSLAPIPSTNRPAKRKSRKEESKKKT